MQGKTEQIDSATEEGKGVRGQSRQSPNSFLFLQPRADAGAPEVLLPSLEHTSNPLITGKLNWGRGGQGAAKIEEQLLLVRLKTLNKDKVGGQLKRREGGAMDNE